MITKKDLADMEQRLSKLIVAAAADPAKVKELERILRASNDALESSVASQGAGAVEHKQDPKEKDKHNG